MHSPQYISPSISHPFTIISSLAVFLSSPPTSIFFSTIHMASSQFRQTLFYLTTTTTKSQTHKKKKKKKKKTAIINSRAILPCRILFFLFYLFVAFKPTNNIVTILQQRLYTYGKIPQQAIFRCTVHLAARRQYKS